MYKGTHRCLLLLRTACPFSGVATANHCFPFHPVLCIFYSDFYCNSQMPKHAKQKQKKGYKEETVEPSKSLKAADKFLTCVLCFGVHDQPVSPSISATIG